MEINDDFPDKWIRMASHDVMPWFVDVANFLASEVMPEGIKSQQWKNILYKAKKFY